MLKQDKLKKFEELAPYLGSFKEIFFFSSSGISIEDIKSFKEKISLINTCFFLKMWGLSFKESVFFTTERSILNKLLYKQIHAGKKKAPVFVQKKEFPLSMKDIFFRRLKLLGLKLETKGTQTKILEEAELFKGKKNLTKEDIEILEFLGLVSFVVPLTFKGVYLPGKKIFFLPSFINLSPEEFSLQIKTFSKKFFFEKFDFYQKIKFLQKTIRLVEISLKK